MAHTVDEVNVLIKAQTEQFQKEIDRVNSKLDSISKQASKASAGVSVGAKLMGLKMAAMGAAVGIFSTITQKAMTVISASTGGAVKRFDTLKNFPRVMGNLGISAQDSQASIGYLSKKLEGIPTTLDEATTAVQRFTATNGNLRASTAIYLALNNAILAGGANAQLQASAMEQLQQAYAKGKPELQDWKTLMQAMPAQLKQIANAMGYMDSSQLYNALQNGKASMDDFMRTVVRLNTEGINGLGSFEQQAAGATGGVATSFTNMKNAIVRGIAACMDAIGQSNIAGFFNVVKDVILTASNYVAAFVKLVLTAINAVRALFGLGSIGAKNVATSGGQAANSMANVGKAAQGSTKDIGNTAKAAKKLQKQLAGFDEMNVLSKQDTDGSGGSGGSGGGSGSPSYDVSGINIDDSGISKGIDKVNAIFERLKNAFKGINFDPLLNSFKNLKSALEPFMGNVGKGIEWFFNNVIKPVTKWTIERALPVFFNLLAGALKILNPLLEGASNGLKFLWDNFLSPVMGFAAESVVHFFEILGDFFNIVTQNEDVNDILKTLGTVIGVVVGVWAAWNAALIAFNVIGGIAVGIFSVLTSPITIVIGAIAALIAVIVLCIKHWDQICKFVGFVVGEIVKFVSNMVGEVGKFFENLWSTIVGVFAGVGKWFSDRFRDVWNGITGVIGGIGKWFGDRWNDIANIFSGVGNWFGDKFRGAWNGITGAFSGITNWAGDRWNDIKNAFSGAWQAFSDIGKNIWNGLKAGIGDIGQKMKDMFNGAVDGVKKFLGIHSPSKLFMNIGDYMGQGLNIGFEDNFDSMIKSAGELAHEIDSRMQMSIPKPADIDIDINRKNSVIGGYIDDMKSAPFILNIDGEKVFEGVVNRANTQTFLRNMGIFDI
jgi:tape measure domain-containing protein